MTEKGIGVILVYSNGNAWITRAGYNAKKCEYYPAENLKRAGLQIANGRGGTDIVRCEKKLNLIYAILKIGKDYHAGVIQDGRKAENLTVTEQEDGELLLRLPEWVRE